MVYSKSNYRNKELKIGAVESPENNKFQFYWFYEILVSFIFLKMLLSQCIYLSFNESFKDYVKIDKHIYIHEGLAAVSNKEMYLECYTVELYNL